MVFLFIIEHTMLPIFGLTALGFLLDKKLHLDVRTLSKFLMYIVIPSFIFTSIYTTDFPATSVPIILTVLFFLILSALIAEGVGKARGYDAGMIRACRNALMFNNTGNLGVSLILLIFSHPPFLVNGQPVYLAEAMVVQLVIYVIQSVFLNTLGLYQAARGNLTVHDTLSVIFRMPMVYMISAALICRWAEIDATQFFFWPVLDMAGHALLPVAMITVGIQLSQSGISRFNTDVCIAGVIKLIFLPILGLCTVYAANWMAPGTFSAVGSMVFLVYCSIPTAVNTAFFAMEFNNNGDYALQTVMNTTAFSAFTIPIVVYLGHLLFV